MRVLVVRRFQVIAPVFVTKLTIRIERGVGLQRAANLLIIFPPPDGFESIIEEAQSLPP